MTAGSTLRRHAAHWHAGRGRSCWARGRSPPAPPPSSPPPWSATGYLADDGMATAAFLAMRMHRPLFCEGEPGTGKTALAQALAKVLDAELIRLQCHEGIDASPGALRLGLPTPAAAPARAGGRGQRQRATGRTSRRRSTTRASCWPGRSCGRCRRARRAAGRRGRPRRRRVRGVPARGAHRARGDDPRARRDSRGRPAARRADLEPHPRGARRAEAPLPVPVAGPPRRRPGDRHPARAGCPGCPSGWPPRSPRPSTGCGRPTCSSRRGWRSRWTGRGPCSSSAPATSTSTPRRRTLGAVLKYREDADRVRARLDTLLAS